MTLDEIYETFMWRDAETWEEYEARIVPALHAAKEYRYLYPFILPIIPKMNKGIWEACAYVIAERSDVQIEPYLYLLFEWLKDMNWPGAWIIFDRLAELPLSTLEDAYNFSRREAARTDDALWLMALDDFGKQINRE